MIKSTSSIFHFFIDPIEDLSLAHLSGSLVEEDVLFLTLLNVTTLTQLAHETDLTLQDHVVSKVDVSGCRLVELLTQNLGAALRSDLFSDLRRHLVQRSLFGKKIVYLLKVSWSLVSGSDQTRVLQLGGHGVEWAF